MSFSGHYYHYKLLLNYVLSQQERLSFFAWQKDAAGAGLNKCSSGSLLQLTKNQLRLQLHPKSGSSRWLRLRNTAQMYLKNAETKSNKKAPEKVTQRLVASARTGYCGELHV